MAEIADIMDQAVKVMTAKEGKYLTDCKGYNTLILPYKRVDTI